MTLVLVIGMDSNRVNGRQAAVNRHVHDAEHCPGIPQSDQLESVPDS
ncbi:hypothetical protein ACFC1L_42195 [Streptomyces sp. NPDC056210]